MPRTRSILIYASIVWLVLFTVWVGYQRVSPTPWGDYKEILQKIPGVNTFNAKSAAEDPDSYAATIINPLEHQSIPRLKCPPDNLSRYEYLKDSTPTSSPDAKLKYFFALNLRQAAPVLPNLLGSVVEVLRFLGPSSCALSIVEGNSDDGTWEVLNLLKPKLKELGVHFYLERSEINPLDGDRIPQLADLRNFALSPVTEYDPTLPAIGAHTTIIFLNDVIPCTADILELIHQRAFQSADMVCAMDWAYMAPEASFYDTWIARSMSGDLFFDIPIPVSWENSQKMFWNEPIGKSRFYSGLSFQVFACWNGGVAFGAGPILGLPSKSKSNSTVKAEKIKFRAKNPDECHTGEPNLFCKDMWNAGYGRIAVVPTVNWAYKMDDTEKLKRDKGFTSILIESEDKEHAKIPWVNQPPEMVKCMPTFDVQGWKPWNHGI